MFRVKHYLGGVFLTALNSSKDLFHPGRIAPSLACMSCQPSSQGPHHKLAEVVLLLSLQLHFSV